MAAGSVAPPWGSGRKCRRVREKPPGLSPRGFSEQGVHPRQEVTLGFGGSDQKTEVMLIGSGRLRAVESPGGRLLGLGRSRFQVLFAENSLLGGICCVVGGVREAHLQTWHRARRAGRPGSQRRPRGGLASAWETQETSQRPPPSPDRENGPAQSSRALDLSPQLQLHHWRSGWFCHSVVQCQRDVAPLQGLSHSPGGTDLVRCLLVIGDHAQVSLGSEGGPRGTHRLDRGETAPSAGLTRWTCHVRATWRAREQQGGQLLSTGSRSGRAHSLGS